MPPSLESVPSRRYGKYMATKTPKKKSSDNVVPFPTKHDFKNPQIDLFQSFLCNDEAEHDQLSNTLDLWDSVPYRCCCLA